MQKYFFIIFIITLYACKEAPSIKLDPMKEAVLPTSNASDYLGDNHPVPDSSWTDRFFLLVNAHRKELGMRALAVSAEISSVAQIHSDDMAAGSVAFGHSGFTGRCQDAREALGGGNWCAENVAAGQSTPEAVFKSWMNSSGHRANIESPRATYSGLGHKRSLSGKYFWTQLFLEL